MLFWCGWVKSLGDSCDVWSFVSLCFASLDKSERLSACRTIQQNKSKLFSPKPVSNWHDSNDLPSQIFLPLRFTIEKWCQIRNTGLISCCVNFHQTLSTSLTQEQKYVVDRMVEAHRLYRAQSSSHSRVGHSVRTNTPKSNQQLSCCPHDFLCVCAQLFEWPYTEEVEGLSHVVSPHLDRLLQFARTVPGMTDNNTWPSNSIIFGLLPY